MFDNHKATSANCDVAAIDDRPSFSKNAPPEEVVFVSSDYPSRGGRTTVIDNLAPALIRMGCRVRVISMWGPRQRSGLLGFRVTRLFPDPALYLRSVTGRELSPKAVLRLPRLALKKLFQLRARLVVSRFAKHDSARRLVVVEGVIEGEFLERHHALTGREASVIVGRYHSSHSSLPSYYPARDANEVLRVFRLMDALAVLSSQDAAYFREYLDIPCISVPNPLSDIGQTARPDLELSRGLTGSIEVVTVARFASEKRLGYMVRLFAQAARKLPPGIEVRLSIYGDGPEKVAVEDAIRETHSEDRVRIMGWTDDPIGAIAGASLFLLTSSFEGWGMSILEAARAGVPCLAFNCSGGVEEVVRATGGVLIEPGEGDQFVVELCQLLGDSKRLADMGSRARASSLRYAASSVAKDWISVYSGIREGICTGSKE